MWRNRSLLDDSAGSPPKVEAPSRRSDFAIAIGGAGCVPYSALHAAGGGEMRKCPGPGVGFAYGFLMPYAKWPALYCNGPRYSALSSSPQMPGDFRKSRWGRVGGVSFGAYAPGGVQMPSAALAPHEPGPSHQCHPQAHVTEVDSNLG